MAISMPTAETKQYSHIDDASVIKLFDVPLVDLLPSLFLNQGQLTHWEAENHADIYLADGELRDCASTKMLNTMFQR